MKSKHRRAANVPRARRKAARPNDEPMPTAVREDAAVYRDALVGVRELRQNLSIYLDEVKQGRTLIVTEHGLRVAELRPVSAALSPFERLVAEGKMTAPTRRLADILPVKLVNTGKPLSDVIREMRDEDPR